MVSIAHSLIVLNDRLDDINASIMEVGGDDSHIDKMVGRLDALELVLREGLGQT